jgi:hypothetical protein
MAAACRDPALIAWDQAATEGDRSAMYALGQVQRLWEEALAGGAPLTLAASRAARLAARDITHELEPDPIASARAEEWFKGKPGLHGKLSLLRPELLPFRCLEAHFVNAMMHFFGKLGNDGFITIFTSVAAHLHDPTFTDLLEVWRSKLGDAKFVTFLSDSVATRLGDPVFTDLLEGWRQKLGNAGFVTIVSRNSVAACLGDRNPLLDSWLTKLGPLRFVTFMTNGVASRLTVDAFTTALNTLHEKLKDDMLFTTVIKATVILLENEVFFANFCKLLDAVEPDVRLCRATPPPPPFLLPSLAPPYLTHTRNP